MIHRGSLPKVEFEKVLQEDPLRVRRQDSNALQERSYEVFYKICISVPILISFSLVFFMMFYISPRGESV